MFESEDWANVRTTYQQLFETQATLYSLVIDGDAGDDIEPVNYMPMRSPILGACVGCDLMCLLWDRATANSETKRNPDYSSPARFAVRETTGSFRPVSHSGPPNRRRRNGRETAALTVPTVVLRPSVLSRS
jgi:hypothetical protein